MRALILPRSLLICAAALAQTANTASSSAAPPADSPIALGPVTFTGSRRARFYAWNWFEPATGQNQYEYRVMIYRA